MFAEYLNVYDLLLARNRMWIREAVLVKKKKGTSPFSFFLLFFTHTEKIVTTFVRAPNKQNRQAHYLVTKGTGRGHVPRALTGNNETTHTSVPCPTVTHSLTHETYDKTAPGQKQTDTNTHTHTHTERKTKKHSRVAGLMLMGALT